MIPLVPALVVGSLGFLLGLTILFVKRGPLMILVGAEFALNSINLLFVAFSRLHKSPLGDTVVLFTIALAAVEVAIGLALIFHLYRRLKIKALEELEELKG